MPIIKTKAKTAHGDVQLIAGEAYGQADLEEDVERLAELEAELAKDHEAIKELKAVCEVRQNMHDEVAKRVSTYVVNQNDVPEDQAWEIFVKGHKVYVAAKTMKRTITDIMGIYHKLGSDVFFKLCKFNLSDLDNYLTAPERELVTKTERVGERKVKVEPK